MNVALQPNKNPQPSAGEVGEAVRASHSPPPFRESVVEPAKAGDLTY